MQSGWSQWIFYLGRSQQMVHFPCVFNFGSCCLFCWQVLFALFNFPNWSYWSQFLDYSNMLLNICLRQWKVMGWMGNFDMLSPNWFHGWLHTYEVWKVWWFLFGSLGWFFNWSPYLQRIFVQDRKLSGALVLRSWSGYPLCCPFTLLFRSYPNSCNSDDRFFHFHLRYRTRRWSLH